MTARPQKRASRWGDQSMFPIYDSVTKHRVPIIVCSLILLNALLFIYRLSLTEFDVIMLFQSHGLLPYQFFGGGSFPNGRPVTETWPLITAAFLHWDWFHTIFNMWALWIFGATLEGGLGAGAFLILYLGCAVISSFTHGYFNPYSSSPMIGASGAIAGVIGAYTVLYPRARIALLIPIIIIPFIFRIRALTFAAIWFSVQLFLGIHFLGSEWDVTTPAIGISVAWWAHIGGFIAGVLLVPFALLLRRPTMMEAPSADRA